jgi:ABC-type branched-subunit amino acid transport system ATPase component
VSDGLDISHLTITFGGLIAVDDVSLQAPLGTVTGLIGPNGAGKTTTFNACTGLIRPRAGTLTLLGRDVTGLGSSARAQRGLGRTFQRMELYDSLTVAENVEMGREATQAGSRVLRHLVAGKADRAAARAAAEEALELCDLQPLKDVVAGSLSTGQRRLVELARVLASPARIFLLDEPSSGLDGAESRRFGDIVAKAVHERGIGVLLVEHDMSLVTAICDRVFVLDFGRLLFEGTAREMIGSDDVRSAYLGSAA